MTKAILIRSDDWEGLYVDGYLEAEDHSLLGPDPLYLVEVATKYSLHRADFSIHWVDDEDEKVLKDFGTLPSYLIDLQGDYEGVQIKTSGEKNVEET